MTNELLPYLLLSIHFIFIHAHQKFNTWVNMTRHFIGLIIDDDLLH